MRWVWGLVAVAGLAVALLVCMVPAGCRRTAPQPPTTVAPAASSRVPATARSPQAGGKPGTPPAPPPHAESAPKPAPLSKPCWLTYTRGDAVFAMDLTDLREIAQPFGESGDTDAPHPRAFCPTLVGPGDLVFLATDRADGAHKAGLWRARPAGAVPKRIGDDGWVGLGFDGRDLWLLQQKAGANEHGPNDDCPVRLELFRGPLGGPFRATGLTLEGCDVTPLARVRWAPDRWLAAVPSLSGNPDSAYELRAATPWRQIDADGWPTWFGIDIDGFAFAGGTVYATPGRFLDGEPGSGLYELDLSRGPRAMLAPFRKPRGVAASASAGIAVVEEALPEWPLPDAHEDRPPPRLYLVNLDTGVKAPLVDGSDPDIWPR